MADKKILIIAGPNGAGKTTFATEFLPNAADRPYFVNADLIAAGLSPFNPAPLAVQAGKLMVKQIREHAEKGRSFAFETTLSGRRYARWIPEWRNGGYRVKLFFLRLPTESIERQGTLHVTLKKAFSKLYGYTSSQQGIRHALLDREISDVGLDEAVFMLGACASFASYLWRKHVANGKIEIG